MCVYGATVCVYGARPCQATRLSWAIDRTALLIVGNQVYSPRTQTRRMFGESGMAQRYRAPMCRVFRLFVELCGECDRAPPLPRWRTTGR